MRERVLRVYADTSVFGGAFDEEFEDASRAFLKEVSDGRFRLVVSAVVQTEIAEAPEQVRVLFNNLLPLADRAPATDEAVRRHEAYLATEMVGAASAADALHAALATAARRDLLVSWNFRHIVHFDRIRLYNGINMLEGHGPIDIHSPPEVIRHEQDQGI